MSNTLQICTRRDSNSGGSNLRSSVYMLYTFLLLSCCCCCCCCKFNKSLTSMSQSNIMYIKLNDQFHLSVKASLKSLYFTTEFIFSKVMTQ